MKSSVRNNLIKTMTLVDWIEITAVYTGCGHNNRSVDGDVLVPARSESGPALNSSRMDFIQWLVSKQNRPLEEDFRRISVPSPLNQVYWTLPASSECTHCSNASKFSNRPADKEPNSWWACGQSSLMVSHCLWPVIACHWVVSRCKLWLAINVK